MYIFFYFNKDVTLSVTHKSDITYRDSGDVTLLRH